MECSCAGLQPMEPLLATRGIKRWKKHRNRPNSNLATPFPLDRDPPDEKDVVGFALKASR
jgi:hypothetical protein